MIAVTATSSSTEAGTARTAETKSSKSPTINEFSRFTPLGARLDPQHEKLMVESAIAPEIARERGYRTESTRTGIKRLGFSDSQARTPALVIPLFDVHGECAGYQVRPDQPRVVDGKAVKYETPRGMRMMIDVAPSLSRKRSAQRQTTQAHGEPTDSELPPLIADPFIPLFATEGVRKGDAAVSIGLCCISLLGVWNWRGSNVSGGITAVSDWESIALKSRTQLATLTSSSKKRGASKCTHH
jgi:hypothetical protein